MSKEESPGRSVGSSRLTRRSQQNLAHNDGAILTELFDKQLDPPSDEEREEDIDADSDDEEAYVPNKVSFKKQTI